MTPQAKLHPANKRLLFSLALGVLLGIVTLAVEKLGLISSNPMIGILQRTLFILILPGLMGAVAVSGNVHAFHLWVASGMNGLIYFGFGWLLSHLFGWARKTS